MVGDIAVFLPVYFGLAAITAGTAIPSGLVVPMLLIGGMIGRLTGELYINLLQTLAQDLC